jgi:hypothetical protein
MEQLISLRTKVVARGGFSNNLNIVRSTCKRMQNPKIKIPRNVKDLRKYVEENVIAALFSSVRN